MNKKYFRVNEKYSSPGESNDALLFHGDNLIILPLLMEDYAEKVKCIYIDPPYNNGEVYKHYDDNLGFENWQEQMREVFKALKTFLSNEGSLWVSIDDGNVHHLRLIGEETFGQKNYVTTIIWQHRTSRENRKAFSNNHEYILVFAKDAQQFAKSRNLLDSEVNYNVYKNPDNDPRGLWQSVTANVQDGHAVASQFYTIKAPNGKKHYPPSGRCWVYNEEKMLKEIENGNIWFGANGNGVPRLKTFLKDRKQGITPNTLWLANEVGTTQQAKKELLSQFKHNVFDTPKPVSLIDRIFQIGSNEGDLVMDAFLGSGTSAISAGKSNRRFIGIEVNDHLYEFAYQRLKRNVNQHENSFGFQIIETITP